MSERMIQRIAYIIEKSLRRHGVSPLNIRNTADDAFDILLAMHEPTDEMIAAWEKDTDSWVENEIDDPCHPYKVMIAAALRNK